MANAASNFGEGSQKELRLLEQFVYREAELMDAHRYDEWLALWTEDSLYWAPCNENDIDPERHVSLIYENYGGISERILRLKGKFAHTQTPQSRLLRVVSNVRLESSTELEIAGSSAFVLGEERLGVQTTWFGRTHHTLVQTKDGLKMRCKKVCILNNDAPMQNMTFLV